MNKKNRIIVLVDFSEFSGNLINFADHIAEIINGKVVFVHQVSVLAPGMADIEAKNTIMKTEMDEAYSKLQELAKGKAYGTDAFHVSHKPVLKILEEFKSEQYFDWVFTGLKDTGILERIFIGSTTISIIDNSDLLTVAVPIQTEISIPKKLMVGINRKYPLNKHQFKTVLSNLRKHIMELEFFTILENNENETEASNYLSALQIEYEDFNPVLQLFKGKNAFELLKDRVKHSVDSFLLLQQGSRSLMDYLFRKFMINELVYNTQTPLIVLSS